MSGPDRARCKSWPIARRNPWAMSNGRSPAKARKVTAAPGGASFVVGNEASDREALGRAAMARHAVAAVERVWPVAKADALVIAAGPKMLGALRDALPKALAAKVTTELRKDLMNLPESELARHLTA